MGLDERLLEYSKNDSTGAQEKNTDQERIKTTLKGEEAKALFRLSAYLAPTELHKLAQRLQRRRQATSKGEVRSSEAVSDQKTAIIVSKFDEMAFSSEVSTPFHSVIRPKS